MNDPPDSARRADVVPEPLRRCGLCGVRLPREEDGVVVGRALACLACARWFVEALGFGETADKSAGRGRAPVADGLGSDALEGRS